MPRPRFDNLTKEKQENILSSASEEFSEMGFEAASLNRIIEKAGISKGATYYYFDDKSDLFSTVIERSLTKITNMMGHFSLEKTTAETFWIDLENHSTSSLLALQKHAWLRRWAKTLWQHSRSGSVGATALWIAVRSHTKNFIDRGQDLGVIRHDLPQDLLVEMVIGLGFATDNWLVDHIAEFSEDEIEHNAKVVVSAFKGLLSPPQEAS